MIDVNLYYLFCIYLDTYWLNIIIIIVTYHNIKILIFRIFVCFFKKNV